MPRPQKGYTATLYAYVKPENLRFIEKTASFDGKSKSDVVNELIERARAKAKKKKVA